MAPTQWKQRSKRSRTMREVGRPVRTGRLTILVFGVGEAGKSMVGEYVTGRLTEDDLGMNDAPDAVRGRDGYDRLLTTMAEFAETLCVACDRQRATRISTLVPGMMTLVFFARVADFG